MNNLQDTLEQCDILFENQLISKEHLVCSYLAYIYKSHSEDRTVNFLMHTGSVCFDVINFVIAAFSCIANYNPPDNPEDAFMIDEMVIYKRKRWIYKGVDNINFNADVVKCIILADNSNAREYIPCSSSAWRDIEPYAGSSHTTDGRGIRNNNRSDFFSEIFSIHSPNNYIDCFIVIMSKKMADRIVKGTTIQWGDKTILLTDVVPISYITDSNNHPYRGNSAKNEPAIIITNSVSTARDLIFAKRVSGLFIAGNNALQRGKTEIPELINRKSIRHIIISTDITYNLSEISDNHSIFVCTKEYLRNQNLSIYIESPLTVELSKQAYNIAYSTITPIVITHDIWKDYPNLINKLAAIKYANIDTATKDNFLLASYSLLKLLYTSVFPLKHLESEIKNGKVFAYSSPSEKVEKLLKAAEKMPDGYGAKEIAKSINCIYEQMQDNNPKAEALEPYLKSKADTAIIVAKAYYSQVLQKNNVTTANQFNNKLFYDSIIVIGAQKGSTFNMFKSYSSPEIIVILYDFEFKLFQHMEKQTHSELQSISDNYSDAGGFEDIEYALREYINRINTLPNDNGYEQDGKVNIAAIGTFVDGEKIFFTESYKAKVFSHDKECVEEVPVLYLCPGDILVFTKNTSHTKDIVTTILENLIASHVISEDVMNAYDKHKHWKNSLKCFMIQNDYTYKQLSMIVSQYGASRTEAALRLWLEELTVAPTEVEVFKQIGQVVGDTHIINNSEQYYEASNTIRSVRVKILKYIGKTIINKLNGNLIENDLLMKTLSNSFDTLATTLELEILQHVTDVAISGSMANKPVSL